METGGRSKGSVEKSPPAQWTGGPCNFVQQQLFYCDNKRLAAGRIVLAGSLLGGDDRNRAGSTTGEGDAAEGENAFSFIYILQIKSIF